VRRKVGLWPGFRGGEAADRSSWVATRFFSLGTSSRAPATRVRPVSLASAIGCRGCLGDEMKLPRLRISLRATPFLAVAALSVIGALVCYAAGSLDGVERRSVDKRFAWRGAQSPGNQIVIVAIDGATLRTLGVRAYSNLPRSSYAQVLDRVRAGSPRVICLDAIFVGASKDPSGDNDLLNAIARDGPVLLPTMGKPAIAGVASPPGAVPVSAGVEVDPDGVLRKMVYAPVDSETLAVRAAELFRGRPVDPRDFPGDHAWIDFRGPPGTFTAYPFSDVMAGRVSADAFTDKTVLIGATDPMFSDHSMTSISSKPMAGVEVQANSLWTILAEFPLKSASAPLDVALILALSAILATIGGRKSGLMTLTMSIGLLVVFLIIAQLAFNAGWIVTLVYPPAGLALTTAGMIGVNSYAELRRQRALKKPPAFFISYRRSQNSSQALDIRRELVRRYGDKSVFMDTSSIEFGEVFPHRIISAVRGCSAMLVLIGPRWLDPIAGMRRIDDPNDWVRREIEAGLQRREHVVVPVLLDGAVAPTEAQLPESIRGLARLQAASINVDDLAAGIGDLLNSIERVRQRATRRDNASPAGEP
jgi:CHASE2 domain-containing sensor protein